MRTRAAVVALVLVLVAGVRPGAAELQPRIVNGTLTSGHPSVGALLFGPPPFALAICSGTLIGCSTFLTAAHCVRGADAEDLHVYLMNAGIVAVDSYAVHPASTDDNFPLADVAVVKLASLVTGVRPSAINVVPPAPFIPEPGTIVGFGYTGATTDDSGLKRVGPVTTTHCDPFKTGYTDQELVCWNFTGAGSTTCFGDSGGPLFLDLGGGPVVAGVTSGGTSTACAVGDHAFDANVATYASFVAAEAGTDLGRACGAAFAGDPGVVQTGGSGTLSAADPTDVWDLGTYDARFEIRVGLNGRDDGSANFDLYLARDRAPTPSDFDHAAEGPTQFHAITLPAPAPGHWFALVRRRSGSGAYQLTATAYPCGGCC